jgi:hypothetical protein
MKYASNLRHEFPIFAGVRNYLSSRRAMKRRNLVMRQYITQKQLSSDLLSHGVLRVSQDAAYEIKNVRKARLCL